MFEPKPLLVECDSCHKSAETWNFGDPDSAVACDCCPIAHNHSGECRPVTIYAHAHLTIFELSELMDIMKAREEIPQEVSR